MPSLIGNKPNQVPSNGDLGTLAFQDASNPKVGAVVADSLVVDTNTLVVDSANDRVGIGTSSPTTKLQVVGTDGTAGGTNTLLHLLGNIGGANKSGGLFFRTLNSTTIGTERIAIIQSTDVDNNNRVLALNSAGGNVLIGTTTNNASGGVLQVSNGITFPATQSASSDANTLDDYEEGTFTPTLAGETTAGTTTYVEQNGRYTKIGRQVTVWIYLSYTAATGTGLFNIGGLPFASTSVSNAIGSIITNGLNWSGGTMINPLVNGGTTGIRLYGSTDDGGWAPQNMVNEAADIYITVTYFV